jgi:hypothetical protein
MIEHFLPGLIEGHSPLDVSLFGEQDHFFGGLVLAAGLLETGGRALGLNL